MEGPPQFKEAQDAQQKRTALAEELKALRNKGKNDKAVALLNERRTTPEYTEALVQQRDFEHRVRVAEAFLEGVIDTAPQIGEGAEGQVYFMDPSAITPDVQTLFESVGYSLTSEQPSAAKLLKVFIPGKGKDEATMQRKAHQILSSKSSDDVVSIPKVHLERTLRLRLGRDVSQPKEVIVMEYVPGVTLHRMLRETYLRLVHPKGGVVREEIDDENSDFLYERLAQAGYRVSVELVRRIRNSVRALNAGGIYHHDLHAGNVMASGSIEKGGDARPFIIDFGRSNDRPKSYDDTFVAEERLVARLMILLDEPERLELARLDAWDTFIESANQEVGGSVQFAAIKKMFSFSRDRALDLVRAISGPRMLAGTLYRLVLDGSINATEALNIVTAKPATSAEARMIIAWLKKKAEGKPLG